MNRSTVIFLAGLSLAVAMGSGALLLSQHRQRTLESLEASCLREKNDPTPYNPNAKPWEPPKSTLVCDAYDLKKFGFSGADLQGQIVTASDATFDFRPWLFGSLLLATVSAVPWAWYFLLRRLVELRVALSGRPPEK